MPTIKRPRSRNEIAKRLVAVAGVSMSTAHRWLCNPRSVSGAASVALAWACSEAYGLNREQVLALMRGDLSALSKAKH